MLVCKKLVIFDSYFARIEEEKMKYLLSLLLLLFVIEFDIIAQDSVYVYAQPYKCAGYSICPSGSSSYLVYTGPGIISVDSTGKQQWYSRYLTTGVAWGKVKEAANGDILMLVQHSTIGAGNGDVLFFRMDSIGTIRWIRTYGTTAKESPVDFVESPDGNILILATVQNFSGPENVILLMAISATGDQLWQRSYISDSGPASPKSISIGPDSSVYFAGNGSEGGLLFKANLSGELSWSLAFPDCKLESVVADNEGTGLYLCGSRVVSTLPTVYGAFVGRHTYDGTTLWHRALGTGIGIENSEAYCIKTTPVSHQLVVGGKVMQDSTDLTSMQALSMVIDSAGNLLTAVATGGSGVDIIRDVFVVNDQHYLWAAYTSSFGSDTNILLFSSGPSGLPGCYAQALSPPMISSQISCFDPAYIMDSGNLDVVTYCFPPHPEMLPKKNLCSFSSFDEIPSPQFTLEIFPNPSKGIFEVNIHSIEDKELYCRLIDTYGRSYEEWRINGTHLHLDVTKVAPGLYFFIVEGEGVRILRKVIILE